MHPAELVTKVYDAVKAGEYEVIADELTAQVTAALAGPVGAHDAELRDTRARLVAVEEWAPAQSSPPSTSPQQRRAAVMPLTSQPVGRRERNKQQKLDRITAAARELFAQRGVDEVTAQEIADKADIGAGTLFLYAKNKGELLLLVQNSAYAEALAQGRSAAESIPDMLDAVMAIVRPVVECNRKQVDNGRTYLREIVFGDPEEPHHRDALGLTVQTEQAIAGVLRRDERIRSADAKTLAHIISAIMFVSMAATINIANPVDDLVQEIKDQVRVLLPG